MQKFEIDIQRSYDEWDADRPRDITYENVHKTDALVKVVVVLLGVLTAIVIIVLVINALL